MDKLSQDEKMWRAKSDAETMAIYEEIMADRTRKAAAIKAAKEKARDLSKRASTMSKVAKNSSKKK